MILTSATMKSRLPEIIALLPSVGRAEAGNLASEITAKARENAPDAPPIGEGLVEAIHMEPVEDGFSVVAGDDDVFYGHLVEYGTVHSGPHAFLIPAFEEVAESAGRIQFNL